MIVFAFLAAVLVSLSFALPVLLDEEEPMPRTPAPRPTVIEKLPPPAVAAAPAASMEAPPRRPGDVTATLTRRKGAAG
jgi:hypothetical protein